EVNRLDDDLDRVTFGRAEVGVRLRTLETVEQRLADEEVQLRAALSNEIDADLVEVISEYNAQQASLEASLRASATLVNLSILDFI
ncbi:MAG: flagellar hook protein, partial [Planctomycetota bacterium]